ncbi:MAG: hypothetical protein QOE26_1257 [Verrucomicrobiota bacterium]|jgi:uncharacterized delta-60 repeat protein
MSNIILKRSTRVRVFFLVLIAFSAMTLGARADLTVDNNFVPPTFTRSILPGKAVLLPDGKYFLLSNPETLTDQPAGPLTRYLPDGTLDTSFDFRGDYKDVQAISPTGDGRFYVAATRYIYGVKEGDFILRINNDGSIDPTFTASVAGRDPSEFVRQLLVQPDGKIIVVGFFSFNGNSSKNFMVRLLANGSLDSGFSVSPGGDVVAAALQSDGKILICGFFQSVNNATLITNTSVARLNPDGSSDSSFTATGYTRLSANQAMVIQPDGMILVAGNFRIGSGSSAKRMPIIRLTATGALDSGFDSSGLNALSYIGRGIVLQPDGKILGAVNSALYRFNSNGSIDTGFHQPTFYDARFTSPNPSLGTVLTANLAGNGDILVGGFFTDVDAGGTPGYAHYGVVRLKSAGTVDPGLVSSHRTAREITPSAFARLGDGSALVTFVDQMDPAIPYNLGRLKSDGSIDASFTLSSSDPNRFLNGFTARGIKPLPDGNFFVFGIGADLGPHFGKVRPDGTEDTSFATNSGIICQNAAVAPNGKIFTVAETDAQSALISAAARLNADGQIASAGAPYPDQVVRDSVTGTLIEMNVGTHVVGIQPDNKILLLRFTNDRRFHFIRLNDDGTPDGSFTETQISPPDAAPSFPVVFDPVTGGTVQPPNGVWSAPYSIQDAEVLQDGSIIVVGRFTSFGNANVRSVAKLKPNGTIDNTFNAGGGAQWVSITETATLLPTVENIEVQANGKFLITGNFEKFNGVPAAGLARLNANGSVDTSFVAPVQRDERSRITTSAFKKQPDGSLFLSGPYTFSGGSTSRSLIRLIDDSTPGTPPPGLVGNVSTRLGVGTGDDALIEGFIVQGPAGSSKKIIVRAIGPSLAQFGIPDALPNPTLEIHDSTGAIVAMNNDWKITQPGGLITGNQFNEINGSGIAPTNDLESAVIVALAPGSYTAVVRGANNSVGTGVVDAFDLDAGSAARLANIATRGVVQPGDKLMIAGFIIQNGAVKVVVRGIGPSLQQFGISNALPDTTLQLRDQQGTVVLENDDWKSSQQQELEATGLQPGHDLEAALVTTIQPGQYTAQLRGKNNDSGIGVVQVYFLQ